MRVFSRSLIQFEVVVLALAGCSHTAAPPSTDGGKTSPRHVRFLDAGPPPDAKVTCGDTRCVTPASGDALDEIACCLPSGACGLRSPLLGDRCLEAVAPGTVDLECPSVRLSNGVGVQGCCEPGGRCGFFDRFGNMGCIVADTSDAAVRCTYAPAPDCRSVVAVACDGPEDCGKGNVCCARADRGLYDSFGCFVSCSVAESSRHGVWFEVCHSNDDCRDPFDRCEPAAGLWSPLSRCHPTGPLRDAGRDAALLEGGRDARIPRPVDAGYTGADAGRGIQCGQERCPVGGSCCVRDLDEPYCAKRAADCACSGEELRDR